MTTTEIEQFTAEFSVEIDALDRHTLGPVTVQSTGGNVLAIHVDLLHVRENEVHYALFTNTEDGLGDPAVGQTWTCGIYDEEDECLMYGESESITDALDYAETAWRMETNARDNTLEEQEKW